MILSVHTFIDSRLFNHTQFLYDIALAKVVPSIGFSNRVTPVNLPTCGEFEDCTTVDRKWGWPNGQFHTVNFPNQFTECLLVEFQFTESNLPKTNSRISLPKFRLPNSHLPKPVDRRPIPESVDRNQLIEDQFPNQLTETNWSNPVSRTHLPKSHLKVTNALATEWP